MPNNIVKGKIGNALESVAPDHILGVAQDIFDEELQMYQSEINSSSGSYDISVNHLVEGEPTKYSGLAAALGNGGENVPENMRKGGMSIKFIKGTVQSSDNKYVQFMLNAQNWSANERDWEQINLEDATEHLGKEIQELTGNTIRGEIITPNTSALSTGILLKKDNRYTIYVQSDDVTNTVANYSGIYKGNSGTSDCIQSILKDDFKAGYTFDLIPDADITMYIRTYTEDAEVNYSVTSYDEPVDTIKNLHNAVTSLNDLTNMLGLRSVGAEIDFNLYQSKKEFIDYNPSTQELSWTNGLTGYEGYVVPCIGGTVYLFDTSSVAFCFLKSYDKTFVDVCSGRSKKTISAKSFEFAPDDANYIWISSKIASVEKSVVVTNMGSPIEQKYTLCTYAEDGKIEIEESKAQNGNIRITFNNIPTADTSVYLINSYGTGILINFEGSTVTDNKVIFELGNNQALVTKPYSGESMSVKNAQDLSKSDVVLAYCCLGYYIFGALDNEVELARIATSNFIEDLNISLDAESKYYDDNGTWVIDSNSWKGIFIPVKGGESYYIKDNGTEKGSYKTYYSLITAIPESSSDDVYANGTRRMFIDKDASVTIQIPSEAKYIWVSAKMGTINSVPSSVIKLKLKPARYVEIGGFNFISHRGFNMNINPENTIYSFAKSKQMGYGIVETDVRFTSDNVPVLLHDASIDATTDGSGQVSELTLSQIETYNCKCRTTGEVFNGVHIPTFDYFCKYIKNNGIKAYVELKDISAEKMTIISNIVNKYNLSKEITYIGGISALNFAKDECPSSRLALISGTIEDALSLKTDTNSVILSLDYASITDSLINGCIANNIQLETWVQDSSACVNRFPYITGITTNKYYPWCGM